MKEMVGGCCVCSDERGWDENPLVYCDGNGCNVAVHQGMERCDLFFSFLDVDFHHQHVDDSEDVGVGGCCFDGCMLFSFFFSFFGSHPVRAWVASQIR